MIRSPKRIARMKRSKERRIAAEMKALEQRLKSQIPMSPEKQFELAQKRHAKRHGRPSHYGKPESYWRRRNTPKSERAAARTLSTSAVAFALSAGF